MAYTYRYNRSYRAMFGFTLFLIALFALTILPNLGKPLPEIYYKDVTRLPFFVAANAMNFDVLGAIRALTILVCFLITYLAFSKRIEITEEGIAKKWATGSYFVAWNDIEDIYFAKMSRAYFYQGEPYKFYILERTALIIKSEKALRMPLVFSEWRLGLIDPPMAPDKILQKRVLRYVRYAEKNISDAYFLLDDLDMPDMKNEKDRSAFSSFSEALRRYAPSKAHIADAPADFTLQGAG